MSDMLNITRIHNSVSALSAMRRICALVRDYSEKRNAFGAKLNELPLHIRTLADMENTYRGNLSFLLSVADFLSKSETEKSTQFEKHSLRFLTPILKLFTAKEAVRIVSEGLEAFGGVGYMENSNIPHILRDA